MDTEPMVAAGLMLFCLLSGTVAGYCWGYVRAIRRAESMVAALRAEWATVDQVLSRADKINPDPSKE